MKKLTKITIKNFKGYLREQSISLENGENLLVYGENGSGKTSLSQAIKYFFRSSIDEQTPFEKNYHTQEDDGWVKLRFSDYNEDGCNTETSITLVFHSNREQTNTKGVQFIKDTAQTRGFLDYTDILKLYNYSEPTPNLFSYIINTLLGNHMLPAFSDNVHNYWNHIIEDTITRPYNRRSNTHKRGLNHLILFETNIRNLLDKLIGEVNRMLATYFEYLNLKIEYELQSMIFSYGRGKRSWKIPQDLRLRVVSDGTTLTEYGNKLNEARLSAISICLYLSSILQNPQGLDYKSIFLDDIFIGLDSGNRKPIIKILEKEFSDYQLIISTYDRSWYNMLSEPILNKRKEGWRCIEIYEGESRIDDRIISDALIINSENSFNKALKLLNSQQFPDYPGAANYLRKAYEELLCSYFPKSIFVSEELEIISSYKLTVRLKKSVEFICQWKSFFPTLLGVENALKEVQQSLRTLLHPLSHSVPDMPVYKRELMDLVYEYHLLQDELSKFNFVQKTNCLQEITGKLRFTVPKKNGEKLRYIFKLKESIYKYIDENNETYVSDFMSHLVEMHIETVEGKIYGKFNPSNEDERFTYKSMAGIFEELSVFIPTQDYGKDAQFDENGRGMFEINKGDDWVAFPM